MKKILYALVIFVYCIPVSLFLAFYLAFRQESQGLSILGTFFIPIIFMIIVFGLVITNIIVAICSIVRLRFLPFRTIMILKLYLIPFYTINFVCLTIASMVFHVALIIWPLIPFIILYTYLTMIGTSAHVIAKLINLRQNKIITTKQFVAHCLFQIIFVSDVVDSITLTIQEKRHFNDRSMLD